MLHALPRIGAIFVWLLVGLLGCGAPSDSSASKRAKSEAGEANAGAENEDGSEGAADKRRPGGSKKRSSEKHTCNICGSTKAFKTFNKREHAQCPVCRCVERHRLLLHYFEHELELFDQKLDVLHLSPNECEETVLRHQPNWHYVTSDYEHTEDLRLDLTKADQPDDSWDVMIVYHIFEHIPEDQKAMNEMFRILRPGGRAFVQVPLELDVAEIHEDPTITSAKERQKHFGQSNHVRKYSIAGFRERLEAAGFAVEAVNYIEKLDPKLVAKHRMSGPFQPPVDESIWVATKPGEPGEPAKPDEPGKPDEPAKRGSKPTEPDEKPTP